MGFYWERRGFGFSRPKNLNRNLSSCSHWGRIALEQEGIDALWAGASDYYAI